MKKYFSLLLVVVMIFSLAVPTFAATDKKGTVAKEETIKVKLCNYIGPNGKWVESKYIKFDVDPIIDNGRTLVPIRAIAEELGYTVECEPAKQKNIILIHADLLEYDAKGDKLTTFYEKNNQLNSFIYSVRQCQDGYGKNIDGSKRKSGLSDDFMECSVDDMLYNPRKIHATSVGAQCYLKIGSKIGSSGIGMAGGANYGIVYNYIMDVTPKIKDGRTLLPLRAVGELLGLQVDWDGTNRTVIITA